VLIERHVDAFSEQPRCRDHTRWLAALPRLTEKSCPGRGLTAPQVVFGPCPFSGRLEQAEGVLDAG